MLRTALGFDHIVKNVGDTWFANSGYDISRPVTASGKTIIINDDGALSCPLGAPNGGPTQACINFSKYLVAGVDKIVVSFRSKVIVEGVSGPLFYIGSVSSGADASFVVQANQISTAWTLGTEFFIEVEMNLLTNVTNIYVNNAYVGAFSMTAAVATAIRAGNLAMFFNVNGQNNNGHLSFRDFFVTDSASGDGMVNRIGDRRVNRVDFDVAAGTGWTTTNGADLLATLKVSPETANPAFAVAPSTKAPLALSMKATHADTSIVEAIVVHLAGKTDVSGVVTKVQMTDGSQSSAAAPLRSDFTTTLKYGIPAGVFVRHPSGARWNTVNMDSTSFVVVPDQVS